ncbi:MAG: hypothetical protein WC227_02930 [Patescibacteria group bacterium]
MSTAILSREDAYKISRQLYSGADLDNSDISKFLYSLRRSGYVEQSSHAQSGSLVITNKARLAVVEKVASLIPNDDKFRFVSFDIPETMRHNRDMFRRVIKRLGLKQIQKSLWVCKKDVGKYIELAMDEYAVSEYVIYMVVLSSSADEFINNLLKETKGQ